MFPIPSRGAGGWSRPARQSITQEQPWADSVYLIAEQLGKQSSPQAIWGKPDTLAIGIFPSFVIALRTISAFCLPCDALPVIRHRMLAFIATKRYTGLLVFPYLYGPFPHPRALQRHPRARRGHCRDQPQSSTAGLERYLSDLVSQSGLDRRRVANPRSIHARFAIYAQVVAYTALTLVAVDAHRVRHCQDEVAGDLLLFRRCQDEAVSGAVAVSSTIRYQSNSRAHTPTSQQFSHRSNPGRFSCAPEIPLESITKDAVRSGRLRSRDYLHASPLPEDFC
jgi:hypothetical protein